MPFARPQPHILYVEDDANLSFVTLDNLELRGYRVTHCADGAAAVTTFTAQPTAFDLCLLDVMLPQLDGFGLARHIRARNPHVPILFLSAKSLNEDRIIGFQTGADDYITKPFSMEELVLRIEVFLRRRAVEAPARPVHRLGSYQFYPHDFRLLGPEGETRLTQKEGQLLAFFAQHLNQVLRREDILQALWGDDDYFLGRSLDVFVSRLRKYLHHDPALQLQTIHRVGFILRTEIEPATQKFVE